MLSWVKCIADASVKAQFKMDLPAHARRFGYFVRPDMGKELWQVRLTSADAPWPLPSTSFRSDCEQLYVLCGSRLFRGGEVFFSLFLRFCFFQTLILYLSIK